MLHPSRQAIEEAARPGWQARLVLGFERRGETSALVRREHFGPLRVQKALYPEGPDVCHAILLHPPAASPAATAWRFRSMSAPAHARC
jgi:hypothetical protein